MAEASTGDAEPLSSWTYLGVGLLWFAADRVVGAAGLTSQAPYLWIAAAFLATFGAACLYNGARCGALHCRISGPAYLALALLAIASALGLVSVSQDLVMALFGGVFLASYAIEHALASRRRRPA